MYKLSPNSLFYLVDLDRSCFFARRLSGVEFVPVAKDAFNLSTTRTRLRRIPPTQSPPRKEHPSQAIETYHPNEL